MSTFSAKPQDIERGWFVVDATDQVLGRLATEVARRLRGKHKPIFTPHMDTGDFVIVTNAKKIRLTGKKDQTKQYDHYTYYPGGHKYIGFAEMRQKKPEKIIIEAVRRMLPKNKLGRKMLSKLKVYPGPEHLHAAQLPKKMET